MVEKTAFTPGPWRVFTTRNGGKVIGIGEVTGEGVTDCGFGIWRSGKEMLANAHLIASSPDMFSALEEIDKMPIYDAASFQIEWLPTLLARYDKALALSSEALKKARGEQ